MSLFDEVPGKYPLQAADCVKKPYVRIQRTRAERRANRLAGKAERKRVAAVAPPEVARP